MSGGVARLHLTDTYGLTLWGGALLIVGGVAALFLVFAAVGITVDRHFSRINCAAFSRNTGRPTKFVVYNFANTGECLTPSGRGTWIPTSALREFGQTP